MQEHEKGHFSQFVTEDINDYIARKRRVNVYGNNVEIQACAEIYNRPIEVYSAVSGDSMWFASPAHAHEHAHVYTRTR